MAEQEACTELVKQASQDQSGQSIDGESLLLPLLQGLLDAPETEQPHDSGTESGEDQRSGLIAEVQKALEKLSLSLRSDATDITPERRSSLLQLVTKLQAGLTSATIDRRQSSQARFNRRKERSNRHTIGVSSEELADARRLIEEISCPSQSSSRASLIPKQNSESNVNQHSCSYISVNQIQPKTHVKNSTPKPFSCSNSVSASSTSSSIQTPSEDCIGYLFNEENKESDSVNQSPLPYDNTKNDSFNQKTTVDLFQNCQNGDNYDKLKGNVADSEEDDSSTIKTLDNFNKPDLLMQSNPIYHQSEKHNKLNSRKLKMRRANTIDIPKPLHFYEYDDEDETDQEDEDRRRRNNYLALRGPIRVGNVANRSSMPILEPKTENDKKFLAFINKHNDRNQRHSLWANNAEKNTTWNNKFDHLKTNFEMNTDNNPKNYWKSSDDSIRYGSKKYDPKISKTSARNLKRMFEEKQRQTNEERYRSNITQGSLKLTNIQPDSNFRIIPQPLPMNKFSHAPSSAFQPVNRNPTTITKVEKPQNVEISKTALNINDGNSQKKLYLYSPKSQRNEETTVPTSPSYIKPWVGNTNQSRVLTLAAKKFENNAPPPSNNFQPNRLNREKINVPHFKDTMSEKLTAPYLVKSIDQKSNTVRKLSGQYDNLGSQMNKLDKTPQFPRIPENNRQIEGFQARFTVPQNYAIRYDKPKPVFQPQKNIVSRFPFEHQPSPSDVKKYNQIHHNDNSMIRNDSSNFNQNYQPTHLNNTPRIQRTNQINERQNSFLAQEDLQSPSPRYKAQTQVTTQIFSDPRSVGVQPDRDVVRPKYDSQTSVESLKEYQAINSRVMSAPVAQSASTVRQKSPMTRNEHDMDAAFALKNVLQRVSNSPSPNPQQISPLNVTHDKQHDQIRETYESSSKAQNKYSPFKEPERLYNLPKNYSISSDNGKKTTSFSQFCEVTDKGEHIVTGKLPIPAINVRSPDINFSKPSQSQVLSKSDSWHQICLMNQTPPQHKPSARSSPNARSIMKSKSTHSVIPAKQFEAGMTKEEILEKKKTLEGFFGKGTDQSISPTGGKVVKRAINRTKTSEKNAQYRQTQSIGMPSGLMRSRTLPDIVCPDLLDETNVDKAFDELFSSS